MKIYLHIRSIGEIIYLFAPTPPQPHPPPPRHRPQLEAIEAHVMAIGSHVKGGPKVVNSHRLTC